MNDFAGKNDIGPKVTAPSVETPAFNVAAYESSLVGEYARMLLILFTAPLTLWFAYKAFSLQTGLLHLAACLTVLTTLLSSRGPHVVRTTLLVGMTINVFSFMIAPYNMIGEKSSNSLESPVFILLFCLGIASIFEIVAWSNSISRVARLKASAWGLLLVPTIIYVLGIPLIDSLLATWEPNERKLVTRDPDWSILNEAAFRSSKFAVFSICTYFGACIGSFLNVVAACAPQGEQFLFRDSKCPECDTKISRLDNLPIFSYLNLGAKCRSCKKHIPARYVIVELVAATIFGSLFLYELVTGCNNVPHMEIRQEGILWIILYPKWPAIGIFLFHCFFMCAVLVLALMEWDRLPLKMPFAFAIGLSFFVAAAVYFPLQPIPLFDSVYGLNLQLAPWLEQAFKLLLGGAFGATIGRTIGLALPSKYWPTMTFAFLLCGVVLGWQALLQISVMFAVLCSLARLFPHTNCLLPQLPTSFLLLAIAIHHPFWNLIANSWGVV